MSSYPRETQELVTFEEVSVNGTPSVAFTWQVTPKSERPTGSWSTPVDVGGGKLGFMLQPVADDGTQRVWVKIAQSGQQIVELAGEVERT